MYLPSCSNAYDDITDFEIFKNHKNTKIRISVFGPEITPSLDTFHAVIALQIKRIFIIITKRCVYKMPND